MIKTALAFSTLVLLAVPAMADHPAVGYWFVEAGRLTDAVNRAEGLAKLDQSTLDEIAECHGHFAGNCNLWLHARAVQFRLEATDDGNIIDYSLVLSRPEVKRQSQSSQGRLVVGNGLTAKDGWEKESFVLVLQRLNLKK